MVWTQVYSAGTDSSPIQTVAEAAKLLTVVCGSASFSWHSRLPIDMAIFCEDVQTETVPNSIQLETLTFEAGVLDKGCSFLF